MKRALLIALGCALLAACSSSSKPKAAVLAGAACLDRPGQLPRPPQGGLPCELIPPGLTLGK